jgi:branched-chain amino acid transport system substrate-binding protein
MGSAVFLVLAALCASVAHAQPVRIGDINSYKAFPEHLEPYRKGWRLAQEELNAAGGVSGRRIEVVSRDDAMRADDAVRHAAQLVAEEKVDLLMGGFTSGVSLALAAFANRKRIVYLATTALTGELAGANASRYTFSLRPSGAMQAAMLLPEAMKLDKQRWAIVYPHNIYDSAAVASFRTRLMKEQPSVDVVYEQIVPLGQIDAWGIVRWLEDNQVQAVLSLLFGADLREFVTRGREKNLFARVQVLNPLAGQPEDHAYFAGNVPEGWWVTGYPTSDVDYGSHQRFVAQYRKRWGESPAAASLYGYTALIAIAHALRRSQSTDSERLVKAFEELRVATPVGPLQWRKDRHSTMGAFVGQLAATENGAEMVRWRYESSARYLPPEP